MIFPIYIIYSPTYEDWSVRRLVICITVDNSSDNTVGGSCCSVHQAVNGFPEDHIDMISSVHRRCQTRASESGHINEPSECVTIAGDKCRRAIDRRRFISCRWPVIALELSGKSLSSTKLELMKPSRRPSVRNNNVLKNAQSHHICRSPLKFVGFGLSSPLLSHINSAQLKIKGVSLV